jgi:hypothetical protein
MKNFGQSTQPSFPRRRESRLFDVWTDSKKRDSRLRGNDGGFLRAAVLVLVTWLLPGAALAAVPDTLAVRPIATEYEIYVGGVHLLHAEARADLSAKTYRMAAKAQTVGIWDDWFPWETTVESVGKNKDGTMQPKHYKTTSSWQHKPQLLMLDYKEDGGVVYAKESTDAPEPQERLGDDVVGKTLDPLSGILQLLAHYTMKNDCSATTAVFDGKRRFDLTAQDLGAVWFNIRERQNRFQNQFAGTKAASENFEHDVHDAAYGVV